MADALQDARKARVEAIKSAAAAGLSGGAQNVAVANQTGNSAATRNVSSSVMQQAQNAGFAPTITLNKTNSTSSSGLGAGAYYNPYTSPNSPYNPNSPSYSGKSMSLEVPAAATSVPNATGVQNGQGQFTVGDLGEGTSFDEFFSGLLSGKTSDTGTTTDNKDEEDPGQTLRDILEGKRQFISEQEAKRLANLEDYKTQQEDLIQQEAEARDQQLTERRQQALEQKQGATAVTGLQEQAARKQLERSRKKAYGSLRASLAELGGLGTTGAGELDFALLGEEFDSKAIDIRLNAAEQLQEIETTYMQLKQAIESDQSKSDLEKVQALERLNTNTTSLWTEIQNNKETQMLDLVNEAYSLAKEDIDRRRGYAENALTNALQNGTAITPELYAQIGVDPASSQVYDSIIAEVRKNKDKEQALSDLETRLNGIGNAILDNFTVEGKTISALAQALGEDPDVLMEQAQALADAMKADAAAKMKSSGEETTDEWDYSPRVGEVNGVPGLIGTKGGKWAFEPTPDQTTTTPSQGQALAQGLNFLLPGIGNLASSLIPGNTTSSPSNVRVYSTTEPDGTGDEGSDIDAFAAKFGG